MSKAAVIVQRLLEPGDLDAESGITAESTCVTEALGAVMLGLAALQAFTEISSPKTNQELEDFKHEVEQDLRQARTQAERDRVAADAHATLKAFHDRVAAELAAQPDAGEGRIADYGNYGDEDVEGGPLPRGGPNVVVKAEDFGPDNLARLRAYGESRANRVVARLLDEDHQEADETKDWLMAQTDKKKPVSYEQVVFMQGDDAEEPLRLLDEEGTAEAMEYLKQWDYGDGDGERDDRPPWGKSDDVYAQNDGDFGRYVLSWNRPLGYIGLTHVKLKWEDESDQD